MSISANYPVPVYVNGYACMNCAQVAEAKRDINPADPQAGPGGIDAKNNPSATPSPAVTFGGVLANTSPSLGGSPTQPPSPQASPGQPSSSSPPSPTSGLGGLVNISV